ncbi:extracellular solute-binding protein [Actinacidiphila sp. DG2A-62]|uniref:extracellular solute-binding protein n=1 Tax=Actinacidiphila sp. DG2A-62 TaxID=3108821 RepID=UPI002DBC5329|nr:extracellular solute-binding protein [Actinacidiphila sp. DG2A-62]MEC3992541.1 extracellular solute-binding protein [Actinacidiphila sp. DG2A-62]
MRTRLTVTVGIAVITSVLAAAASGCGSGSGSGGKTIKVVFQKQLNSSNTVQPDYLAGQVKAFEKANPGTTVKLVPVTASENDYYTKIQLMMRSPVTAPDLVYEDTATINSDVASGYLKPLDSYLATWKDWGQYAAASKAAMKYAKDGKTYGVPDNTDTRGIWYNKTLFQRAGIAVPWQPKTWDDVLGAARTIKAKVPGVTPLNVYTGTAGGEQSSMQGFEMLLYGTPAGGSALYDASKQKWVVGSTGFKDALNFVHTVYSENLGPKVQQALDVNIGASVGTEMIPQGKLAIDIDGSWMPNNWIRTGPKPWPQWQTTMGQAAMPTQHGQGKGRISMSGGWAWSIPAKAKNTDLAWKFLQSLETERASAQWNNVNATIPVRQDVAADPAYLKALPTNQFFSGLVADTYYRPGVPTYTQVSTAIQKAMESVTTGQASVDKAASTYDGDVKSAVGADQTVQGAQ